MGIKGRGLNLGLLLRRAFSGRLHERIRGGERHMVQVVMDTTTGMTRREFDQSGITMIPLYVRDGDKVYREQVDIFPDEFYRRERAGFVYETCLLYTSPSPRD